MFNRVTGPNPVKDSELGNSARVERSLGRVIWASLVEYWVRLCQNGSAHLAQVTSKFKSIQGIESRWVDTSIKLWPHMGEPYWVVESSWTDYESASHELSIKTMSLKLGLGHYICDVLGRYIVIFGTLSSSTWIFRMIKTQAQFM